MTRSEPFGPVRYCLVCDNAAVESAVRLACPPPYEVEVFPLENLVDGHLQLSEHGHRVVACARGAAAVLVSWDFDLAPVINTLCSHVRRELLAPVIALVGGAHEEAIQAMAAGADATAVFPLYPPLVDAKALAYRRMVEFAQRAFREQQVNGAAGDASQFSNPEALEFGPLVLDPSAYRFYAAGQEVELTPREFSLVEYLIRHGESVLTRHEILDNVWGISFDTGTNMVDVYMYFLRRKLEARGVRKMIQTVRGRGYRLVLPERGS